MLKRIGLEMGKVLVWYTSSITYADIFARYIDTDSGRRSDTPHHYIYNQIDQRKNLHIMVRRKVVRVIFEYVILLIKPTNYHSCLTRGTRAVGVEYVDDVSGRRAGVLELSVAYASRLVVVSAGAFGSPSILERSGIGAANLLKKNDIQQVVDLPGVGENYMGNSRYGVIICICAYKMFCRS